MFNRKQLAAKKATIEQQAGTIERLHTDLDGTRRHTYYLEHLVAELTADEKPLWERLRSRLIDALEGDDFKLAAQISTAMEAAKRIPPEARVDHRSASAQYLPEVRWYRG